MARLLYITAHVKEPKDSFCLSVGEAFLKEYAAKHPANEIVRLNLFRENIPFLDGQYIAVMFGKIEFEDLDGPHRKGFQLFEENLSQFMEADHYVFAFPLWNLGYPPIVKAYLDTICINGKTFHYTASGAEGLLKGKKGLCIQSAGGIYSQGPAASMEHGQSHVKAVMNFLGVSDFETIWVEGVDIKGIDTEAIKEKAIAKAMVTANRF